jgi:hypothetical protein
MNILLSPLDFFSDVIINASILNNKLLFLFVSEGFPNVFGHSNFLRILDVEKDIF